MLSLGLALMTLLVPSPQAGPDKVAWVALKPADGAFSAEMPAEAQALNQELPGPNGPIRQAIYYCKLGGALYNIQAIAPPGAVAEADRRATLDREQKGYIASNKGKLVREGRITLGGHPGWDFTIESRTPDNPGVITSRVRMVLAGPTFLIATVMSPRDKPLPDDAARFFEAFQVAATPPDAPRPDGLVADATADQALRTFFLAMNLRDEPTLRAVTLPAEGFEALLTGKPIAGAQALAARAGLAVQPIRVLKPGDEVTLPGNRKMTVKPEEVADDRAILMPEGAPVPTRLQKVAGRWKVDARPIIVARKAAEAARAKAQPKPADR